MLRQAARLNSLTELALTKLDVLDTFDTVKVCVGYSVDGERLPHYPDRLDLLERVVPDYVELPGWTRELRSVRQVGELPPAARIFVELIEAEVGVPISVVGVGAERDDYLHWG
jgi:adenylosuccinate synthase